MQDAGKELEGEKKKQAEETARGPGGTREVPEGADGCIEAEKPPPRHTTTLSSVMTRDTSFTWLVTSRIASCPSGDRRAFSRSATLSNHSSAIPS